jgi:hypothetical protein
MLLRLNDAIARVTSEPSGDVRFNPRRGRAVVKQNDKQTGRP